jgi:hypothetical protein
VTLKQWKNVMIGLSCALILFSGIGLAGAAPQESDFQDVTADHWGYEAIQWAKEHGIVDGYPDGTFKPDRSIGQTEFLAMLIRAYQPKDFSEHSTDGNWKTPYFRYSIKMGWSGSYITPPASKLSQLPSSDIFMPRMYVAKLIANASGRNYDFNDSIQYLLDSGLSEGKTDRTVEGFQGHDLLTRAEAVTFIQHVRSKLDALYPAPDSIHEYDPATVHLSPFEVFPLQVVKPEEYVSFSSLTLENPSQGYSLIHLPTYTIKGTVQKAVGDHLTIGIEYWDSGVFTSVNSLNVPMTAGPFNAQVELPKPGIYRICLYSKQEKIEEDKRITTFYLEYRPNAADKPNEGG